MLQFIKFLLVGLVNTAVGLGTIYACMYFLQMEALRANAVGYGVGVLVSFSLNKAWTFSHRGDWLKSASRYALVLTTAYLVNLEAVYQATYVFKLNPYLAQLFGIVPYTAIGFLGGRYFAFKSPRETPPLTTPQWPLPARPILLAVVIPCYNESAVLPLTVARLIELYDDLVTRQFIDVNSHVYFVDDGSRDSTWAMIESFCQQHGYFKGIKLSRNRGHQNALLAGLLNAEGEAVISVDADLQDDLGAIENMLCAYAAGYEIVYGVRRQRTTDTCFKRWTAHAYYRLIQSMGVDLVFDHADYRLLGRRALEALAHYSEVNLFLRGIIPQLGYRSTQVYYDRAERAAGESKYPLSAMLAFAWQGITSFSAMPLRLITTIGVLVACGSVGASVWAVWIRFFTDKAVPGWTSTVLPLYFLSGIQLLCLGIIGEYISKIYLESKRRPAFFIEKII